MDTTRRADDWLVAAVAGLAAGVIATAVQIALWWLSAVPVVATLIRDARLTAAVVMGPAVLPPSNILQWNIVLIAALIHFSLSIAYGLILARLIGRLRVRHALAAGGYYGMALYLINLHGFTAIFPWFTVARDWITVLTHIAFGTSLAGCYLALRSHQSPASGCS
ncbi:MAG TPA: sodium:proline symporter [Rhodocyclaceae bacterium]|nr:sodium:proline symporter [Rhodocyclaceae bacterium]